MNHLPLGGKYNIHFDIHYENSQLKIKSKMSIKAIRHVVHELIVALHLACAA